MIFLREKVSKISINWMCALLDWRLVTQGKYDRFYNLLFALASQMSGTVGNKMYSYSVIDTVL